MSSVNTIPDVQSSTDTRHLAINKVGIKSIRHPVVVKDKSSMTVRAASGKTALAYDKDFMLGADPLREAGIFTAAAGGTLYNRVVFDPVTKADTFKLTLIWDIVF